MTIFVDEVRHYPLSRWVNKDWCHMVSDGGLDELHAMADALGLERRRLHQHRSFPHYDLNEALRAEALRRGAVPITRRELGRMLLARSQSRG